MDGTEIEISEVDDNVFSAEQVKVKDGSFLANDEKNGQETSVSAIEANAVIINTGDLNGNLTQFQILYIGLTHTSLE